MDEISLQSRLDSALRTFWSTRSKQAASQGSTTGRKDAGARSAVTGGKHLDGFVTLCRDIVTDAGLSEASVHWKSRKEIPGFFRPQKSWDLLVISEKRLLAVVEFKAQVGPSFGNNANNRTEEALGNAVDFWTAYREGAFKPGPRPWLGFVFLLEDCAESRCAVRPSEPHFPVRPEFRDASYATRYQLLLTKLLRERLYDGTCLILSKRPAGKRAAVTGVCLDEELSFRRFAAGLEAHVAAHK